jgi:DNA primase
MYPRGLKISHCLFGAGVAREDYEMFALAKQGVTPKADRISQHRYQNVEPPALVITEGAIDAMVAYEVGAIGVAMLGSRISEEQVEIIKRLAPPQIIVATDADRAGREAEIQVIAMLRHARLGIPIGSANWNSSLGKDLAELQKTTVTNALAQASVDEERFRISAMVYGELRTIKARKQKEMEVAK